MGVKELERMFANNFSSPIFPILAEYYLRDNQIKRSIKVCEIGLKNNPSNLHGEFILSKILIKEEKLKEAEKKLKFITKNSVNINALFILTDISVQLKRSKETIKKYILQLNQLLPNNKKVEQYNKKYLLPKKKYQSTPSIKTVKVKSSSINIDNKLATKTMYNLLLKQKKYYHALEVLNIMSLKKKNIQFIKKNKPDLLKKINQRNQ